MEAGKENAIRLANRLGQGMWLDYIRRGLIKSGELKQLVDLGLSGLTANPTIMEKAIVGSTDYDDALLPLALEGRSLPEIYEAFAIEDIRAAADLMRSLYDRTKGADGYPCLEISPLVANDTEKTIAEAGRLFRALDRPNVMVKVPATAEGIPAIKQLIGEGINVNVTLIFSLDYYEQVMEAYISGLEELVKKGGDPARVASVASFFLSRIDTAVDSLLDEKIKQGRTDLKPLLGKTAIVSAKLAYRQFKRTFSGERFATLRAKGARVQRVLWASTGTKNPDYSDVMYVEPLIGADTVNTLPLATLYAFLDHGKGASTLEQGVDEAETTLEELAAAGVDMKRVTDKLLVDGVRLFSDSYNSLMKGIAEKKARLMAAKRIGPEAGLGQYAVDVQATLEDLAREDVVKRIWRKDHTVWNPSSVEITDRLGWLTIVDSMHEQVDALKSFADETREAGFRHVVLLGMGGSSLGAEVFRRVFGNARGYPELIVLDSTAPEAVQAVAEAIEPSRTVFLVSSKSGTTIEPMLLYRYFRRHVEEAMGPGDTAGRNFVAITDAGTPLVKLAELAHFRRIFLNPSDIGGRYSALSYFGLVPAALLGLDVKLLLDRADTMREGCASCLPPSDNPACFLGACLGTLVLKGRDKLTLVTSPSIASFGLWVEQIIAESTGKDGKGIVPVVGEPLVSPECYGNDRLFVYLRLKTDDNAATDAAMAHIQDSGQPVLTLEMQDRHDLGAEFYRWEFATAVAGVVLGVHPFNQPDVQQSKTATERLLKEVAVSRPPRLENTGSINDLLAKAGPGRYLAVMAYLQQTPALDTALVDLRRKVLEQYHIATTVGYGPRFLHSTGQLHKGGPNTGLFIQLTGEHRKDLAIPGEPYTFGAMIDAQALGDFEALQANGREVIRVHMRGRKQTLL